MHIGIGDGEKIMDLNVKELHNNSDSIVQKKLVDNQEQKKEGVQAWRSVYKSVLVYVVPKSSQPGIVLNFIEIHYQFYKKLSLSISHNPLPGKFKVL